MINTKDNTYAIRRMQEIIAILTEADIAYYRDDSPTMTDRAYDQLTDELKALERDSGLILSGSPTQKVSGEILEELTPIRHTKPMLSADKTKSVEDLVKFAGNQPVLLSWKMDGLTLVLRYENGMFKQAITRGREGLVGEDVTHTVRTFLNVPLSVSEKQSFEVRGEGVISWASFKQLNSTLGEPYSHPRNLASGSTRKLDAREAQKRRLEFWAFDLVSDHIEPQSKLGQLQFLENNGFSVVPYVYLDNKSGADNLRKVITEFDPKSFAYPVDGLILEYDNLIYGKSLGATGHHEHRLIALKWADELVDTRFRGLELATTRTGMASLTAIFDPVEIDGTTVSRAYLHNVDIFDEFQFGIGDEIQVYKANLIIPQVANNKTMSNTYVLPMTCPCCGNKLQMQKTSGGTRQLFCVNPHCAAKLVQKFVHFCDKTRMNIDGLSEATLEKFIGASWIQNFGDLYTLEKHREEIIVTEGFGEKSFERLQASIEKSRRCTLAQFIAGVGIPMVGRHAGKDLDAYFGGSWTAFEKALQEGFDFTQLPDFGQTMHNNIYAWYKDEAEAQLWRPLLEHVEFVEPAAPAAISDNPFMGKTVVATGKLVNYSRDGIQEKLLSLGAKPGSGVSKTTDYLLVGEKAGSKLAKAQQLGVKIITEEEFEAMLRG